MPRVAVLGCGPAGLFAAQALDLHGLTPIIISKKQRSQIYGAQYLHRPIPGFSPTESTGRIETRRIGSREVYAERVYGVGTTLTSWDRVRPEAPAWDLREAYSAAWDKFSNDIIDYEISPDEVDEFSAQFDLVISTIPLWSICRNPQKHKFDSIPILVKKIVVPEELPEHVPDGNWVVYNGTYDYKWYRCSNIFGHGSAEARMTRAIVEEGGWDAGFKVVGNQCDCYPAVVKAGRMGTWQRGVLTHHAFERTLQAIAEQFGIMPARALD